MSQFICDQAICSGSEEEEDQKENEGSNFIDNRHLMIKNLLITD